MLNHCIIKATFSVLKEGLHSSTEKKSTCKIISKTLSPHCFMSYYLFMKAIIRMCYTKELHKGVLEKSEIKAIRL